ncbi:hypothetical protein BT93_E1722 [Corymbia citriodora subsp. variegata]|nr:hypothetical protein BT93_E1722 [Corymbia citriodora subsp. variegata]
MTDSARLSPSLPTRERQAVAPLPSTTCFHAPLCSKPSLLRSPRPQVSLFRGGSCRTEKQSLCSLSNLPLTTRFRTPLGSKPSLPRTLNLCLLLHARW